MRAIQTIRNTGRERCRERESILLLKEHAQGRALMLPCTDVRCSQREMCPLPATLELGTGLPALVSRPAPGP